MKFYPPPVIRFLYKYVILGLFVIFPVYFTAVHAFDTSLVSITDRPYAIVVGLVLSILGCCVVNFAFLEKCFSVLIITDKQVTWKCLFRKRKIIELTQIAEIGAYLENENNGIPVEQIYFSDYPYPQRNMGKNGVIKTTSHVLKFWYSETLYQYIMDNFPSKHTSCLCAYHRKRKNE